MTIRTCGECNREFTPSYHNRKYCEVCRPRPGQIVLAKVTSENGGLFDTSADRMTELCTNYSLSELEAAVKILKNIQVAQKNQY